MRGLVVFALVTASAATAFAQGVDPAQPGVDPAQPVPTPAQPAPTAPEPLRPAQLPPTVAEPLHPPLCVVRGENCRTVLLLETTWGLKPVVATRSGNSTGGDLALEGGLLINAANGQGFGGSFGMRLVSDASALPVVFRGRYRHWLSPRTNVDVAPGFLLATTNRGGTGGTLQLAFERSGKVALVLDVDVYRSTFYDDSKHIAFEVGLGVKFCGFVSIPATLLTLLFAAAGRGTG